MCADDAHVYILNNQNELVVLSAKDLSVKSQKKLAKPSTAITVCGDNIWVGEKNGSLNVLASSNLEEKNRLESVFSKEITCMTSNSKSVAAGDAYRYFKVFNNEDQQEVMTVNEHKDKILDLFMTEENVLSVTLHNAFGLSSLADKKFIRE
jgi:hypothetical protein